jgi:acetolactate synthase-1/2/3 large subunit
MINSASVRIETQRVLSPLNTADRLVLAMEEFGVKTAFGVTGGAIGTVYDRLCRSQKIRVFHAQHETGAAYAAMGRALALLGAELPVCFSTAGPGMTNLLTGVAAAYAESVPLLALTGNASSRHRQNGALQDSSASGIDAVRMFETVTVCSEMIQSPDDAVPLFEYFARTSLRRRKPVHLNLPLDISNLVAPPAPARTPPANDVDALAPREALLLDRFLSASRPVLFAGNGVKSSGLVALLARAAHHQQLPVITTTHGRGAIPEDHACFSGTFGFASDGSGRSFLERTDPNAILFLGTGLGEMSSGGWSALLGRPELKLHVDVDRSKFNRAYSVQGTIERDLRCVLEYLVASAPREPAAEAPSPRPSGVVPRLVTGRRGAGTAELVHPRRLFQKVSREAPATATFFADIGNTLAWAFNQMPLGHAQQLFAPLGLASMGSGLGAALGAATHASDRTVVCVVGDGAALMQGNELKTAAEYDIPVKVVVLNDGGHGMVDHGSRLIGLENTRVRFRKRVDFEGWARALGLAAHSVRSSADWEALDLAELLASPEPMVIDVWVDPSVVPPIGDRARVLGQSESTKDVGGEVAKSG